MEGSGVPLRKRGSGRVGEAAQQAMCPFVLRRGPGAACDFTHPRTSNPRSGAQCCGQEGGPQPLPAGWPGGAHPQLSACEAWAWPVATRPHQGALVPGLPHSQ